MTAMRIGASVTALMFLFSTTATACPFCAKFTRSATDEIRDASAVYFGRLSLPTESTSPEETLLAIDLEIRPNESAGALAELTFRPLLTAVRFGPKQGIVFLERTPSGWKARKIEQTERAYALYLQSAWQIADASARERMTFFFQHLRHPHERIAQDAYAEFAKATFRVTQSARDRYDADLLIQWLEDPATPPEQIGLFGLLLGLTGDPKHTRHLAEIATDPTPVQLVGLDGILGGWCLLDRSAGTSAIIERLNDPDGTSAHRRAALAALQFLTAELAIPDSARILEPLAPALRHEDVVAPLIDEFRKAGRWEVWSELEARRDDERIRPALVRMALVSPLPAPKKWLEELTRTDPRLVEEARQELRFEEAARNAIVPRDR